MGYSQILKVFRSENNALLARSAYSDELFEINDMLNEAGDYIYDIPHVDGTYMYPLYIRSIRNLIDRVKFRIDSVKMRNGGECVC